MPALVLVLTNTMASICHHHEPTVARLLRGSRRIFEIRPLREAILWQINQRVIPGDHTLGLPYHL